MNLLHKKVFLALVLAVVLFTAAGCDEDVAQGYKTLYIASQAYDMGMKTVATLQANGSITAEQRAEINKYASKVYGLLQFADISLSIYNKTKTSENKDKMLTAITNVVLAWPELTSNVDRVYPGAFKQLEVK
jgi:hypothetical protein